MDILSVTTRVFAGVSVLSLLAGPACAQEQRRFDIEEIRVEGNTLLPPAMIETAVTPFLGPDRSADDVEKARVALDALYAQQGYPTAAADIPEQDPSDGVVVLRVTERRVGRLRVRGSRYFSQKDIRDHVPSLAEGHVPNLNDLQRDIVALNQWPDRRVTPVLRPGTAPDTVDVDLDVKETLPAQGSAELTNRQSANTSAFRHTVSLSYNNLWQRGDAISVSYQMAPLQLSDTSIFTMSYLFRVPNSNLAVLVSYLHSNSSVATVGGTGVIGNGDVYGARLQIPLGTEGQFSHSLSVGFDYKQFNDTMLLGADRTVTPITYVPLVAQYQASWINDANETLVDTTVMLGANGLGSNGQAFDQKRYMALPSFSYVRTDLTRRDELPLGLQSSVHFTGQASNDSLISNEQFSVGGIDTVRGYLEAEALGDYGGAIQAELRGPSYTQLLDGKVNEVRGFAFTDAARVGIHNALAQQQKYYGLASTGFGVRMRVLNHVSTDLIGAHALTSGPNTRDGTSRLLFRINGGF